MDEKNLPSSSDDSDADFVPKEEEENSDSGSEVSDCESNEEDNSNNKSRKRKKRSKKGNKKPKLNKNDEKDEEKEIEEEKKEVDVDALWADFKKDVNNSEAKKTAVCSQPSTENLNDKSSKSPVQSKCLNNKPKGGFSFPNKNKVGGLSKVLNQIGKKDKMSTLQKSQLDWNKFKKSEGIEEEIKTYNRGKDGFLEKQDFLQRTDLRQFEIEKDLRSTRRKF